MDNLVSKSPLEYHVYSHRVSASLLTLALTLGNGSGTHFKASQQVSLCLNSITINPNIHSERNTDANADAQCEHILNVAWISLIQK